MTAATTTNDGVVAKTACRNQPAGEKLSLGAGDTGKGSTSHQRASAAGEKGARASCGPEGSDTFALSEKSF